MEEKGLLQLQDHIRKAMVAAISDYKMIESGDRVLVAVSGGKDSTVMALMLEAIKKKSPISFSCEAVILDQKQPGFQLSEYQNWLAENGILLKVIEEDTYSIVREKTPAGKAYCGLCSRLRRGVLYNYAAQHGFNKIALGHHRDDLNETVLMNMFYTGRLASMPPKLISDDKRNTVIRPLCYMAENDILALAKEWQIPIIPCKLCGSQENLKRAKMKALLRSLEEETQGVGRSLLKAQSNIRPSQLMDRSLWDF